MCIRYWDQCNNNCTFCFEKNKSFDGMFSKPSTYAIEKNNECIKSLIDYDKYNYYTFKILGGELFFTTDKVISNALADTIEYFYSVFEQSGMLDKIESGQKIPETLVIASNLLYKDNSTLYQSLDVLKSKTRKTNASMMVSYDLYGRFANEKSVELYYNNYLDIFNKYRDVVRPVVSFIMSKQNINMLSQQVKSRELEVFDALYALDAPFDMTLLLNDSHVNMFSYTKEELHKFIDIILEKYPKFISVFLDTNDHINFKNISHHLTIQGGQVLKEETLFNKHQKEDCLLCEEYNRCRHSYADISYNAFECDVKEILRRCANY